MKRILLAIAISPFLAMPAFAASTNSVGINYSFDDVFGSQFEFDINHNPVSVQVFWKSYSQRLGANNTWNTTGVGLVGIYDLTSITKLDKKVHPYAGLGLMSVSYSWAGPGNAPYYTGINSGLYVVGGVRYNLAPQIDADFNINNFGGLTAGANFRF